MELPPGPSSEDLGAAALRGFVLSAMAEVEKFNAEVTFLLSSLAGFRDPEGPAALAFGASLLRLELRHHAARDRLERAVAAHSAFLVAGATSRIGASESSNHGKAPASGEDACDDLINFHF